MKNHNEFLEEVEEASSFPVQTKEALDPESKEDFAVYTTDEEVKNVK